MSGELRGLQGWVSREPRCPDLLLRCEEAAAVAATGPRPADDAVAVRLVGCAGDLTHHELVELLVLGAPSVTVDLAGCADVVAARGHLLPLVDQLAALGIASLRLLGPAVPGREDPVAVTGAGPAVDAAQLPRSRRQALMLDQPPELPDEGLPPHVRLRDAVLAVAAAQGAPLDADSPAVVLTAPGCDSCGVCVRSCPLGALDITEVPVGGDLAITTLVHLPAACDGCRRCIDLCPPAVLTTDRQHPWQLVQDDVTVPVHTLPTRRCARCAARMPAATPGTRCGPCEQRHHNPFVSTWPAGAARR